MSSVMPSKESKDLVRKMEELKQLNELEESKKKKVMMSFSITNDDEP